MWWVDEGRRTIQDFRQTNRRMPRTAAPKLVFSDVHAIGIG